MNKYFLLSLALACSSAQAQSPTVLVVWKGQNHTITEHSPFEEKRPLETKMECAGFKTQLPSMAFVGVVVKIEKNGLHVQKTTFDKTIKTQTPSGCTVETPISQTVDKIYPLDVGPFDVAEKLEKDDLKVSVK